jgi:SAM-dependent methyltransferase
MAARARAGAPANVTVHEADAMTVDLPAGGYDAVVGMSSLHHLPLAPALERMASWLRPGGSLAVVALPRTDLPRDLPVELTAVVAHRLLGTAFAAGRRCTGHSLIAKDDHAMPVQDPELTTRQVRTCAEAVLPGVRVRRLVSWRYLLTWTGPPT